MATMIYYEDMSREELIKQLEQLQAAKDKLALYTSHNPDCEIETEGGGAKCTCGLDQALKGE